MTKKNLPPLIKADGTVPRGVEIYNTIMAGIEPDLLSENIPGLEEKYKNESPADRASRQERYKRAYAEYDRVYAQWHSDLNAHVAELRRASLKSAEARNRTQEEKFMQNLENQIHSSSPSL